MVRIDSKNVIKERLEYTLANNYRCYSPGDDEAWRSRMIACCSEKGFSAKDGIAITTWLISSGWDGLVRFNGDGTVSQRKSIPDADNYRCYSPIDDEYWRSAMIACCAKSN